MLVVVSPLPPLPPPPALMLLLRAAAALAGAAAAVGAVGAATAGLRARAAPLVAPGSPVQEPGGGACARACEGAVLVRECSAAVASAQAHPHALSPPFSLTLSHTHTAYSPSLSFCHTHLCSTGAV
jgi:hypothetical protein